jgi:hypothetical protein
MMIVFHLPPWCYITGQFYFLARITAYQYFYFTPSVDYLFCDAIYAVVLSYGAYLYCSAIRVATMLLAFALIDTTQLS